jgi:Protein of unknown function (DUF1194)
VLRSINCPAIAVLLLLPATSPIAAEPRILTDANLVTALDVSDSIMRHEEWLEFEGLAKAVVSEAVLDAIAGGRYGRIGFAAFAWSSSGRFNVLVPWTLIESIDDAEAVAAPLRAFKIDRSSWARQDNGPGGPPTAPAFQTDISAAIDFASELALMAPHASRRTVINVCANGSDNVAEDPSAARDRAVAAGSVINGLVMGGKKGLADYFREHVRGGAGSFVIEVPEPAALIDAMIDKLLRDLIAAPQPAPTAVPST